MPCCMSTTSESQPMLAMTSAEKLLGIPHQLLITARPCCQASRTPFGRAISSSSFFSDSRSRQLSGRESSIWHAPPLLFLQEKYRRAFPEDGGRPPEQVPPLQHPFSTVACQCGNIAGLV